MLEGSGGEAGTTGHPPCLYFHPSPLEHSTIAKTTERQQERRETNRQKQLRVKQPTLYSHQNPRPRPAYRIQKHRVMGPPLRTASCSAVLEWHFGLMSALGRMMSPRWAGAAARGLLSMPRRKMNLRRRKATAVVVYVSPYCPPYFPPRPAKR